MRRVHILATNLYVVDYAVPSFYLTDLRGLCDPGQPANLWLLNEPDTALLSCYNGPGT